MKKKSQLYFLIWLLSAGVCAGVGWLLYELNYEIREMVSWEPIIVVLVGICIGTIIGTIVVFMIKSLSANNAIVNTIKSKSQSHDSTTDELKKLKELLDMGAISQEEFDAKKKQLLNL